ncbi:MAG: divergent polysaccharide deacetylase family protein [Desulfobulbaceae bacterium]|nr:divergent polysaccharide deacetylase family protein [Desulfobulbaceae bacterium]
MTSRHHQPPRNRRQSAPVPFWLIAALLLLAALLAVGGFLYLHRGQAPPPPAPAPEQTAEPVAPPAERPKPSLGTGAVDKKPVPPPPLPPKAEPRSLPPPAVPRTDKPRMALIIDDMGYHNGIGEALLDLKLNLSFAFLPFAPHTEGQLRRARQSGRDILLHLPMEATDPKWDPGPGALFVGMGEEELRRTVESDLAAVPGAIGINNHMGSRFTEDEAAMRSFLTRLAQRHLFFLDSQTSSNSVGLRLAREMGIPAIRRHVFLDNEEDKEKIKKQLDSLILLAKKQGIAVGIAHPHQATLDALREFQNHPDRSVELVGIHALISKP